MITARFIAAAVGCAMVFASYAGARAGTLPSIGGTWYANGDFKARCQITQSGSSVSLANQQGATAQGTFTSPSTLTTNWGMSVGTITGTISGDLRRINWSNGTFWSRPLAPVPSQPVSSPVPTPSPTPGPEPLRVSILPIAHNHASPIYIFGASLKNGYGFNFSQCVSFRNVATKEVTEVDFSFVVTNRTGETEADFGWTDKGTFTAPISIENHCFSGRLWERHVVRRMTNEKIHVTQVVFADGTVWKAGAPFLRAYTASGERLAQPTMQSPEIPAPVY
jgi:hypothetical protein